jgi:hypothetical protein
MIFKINGLEKLQKDLLDAQMAADALNRTKIEVEYDPLVPASVESAMAKIEQTISEKTARYRGNALVELAAKGLTRQHQENILARVSAARLANERGNMQSTDSQVSTILHQLDNTVMDLRGADCQAFDRHIKKFSHLLNSSVLKEINDRLLQNINLETWIETGRASQSSMVGSARLVWPLDAERDLGTQVALVHYFAEQEDRGYQFANTFYHVHGGDLTDLLRNMVGQLLVPFVRDYASYVKKFFDLPARAMAAGNSGVNYSQQFHISHSTITSFQAGHQSTANLQITNNAESKEVLLKAFEAIAEALGLASSLPGHDKSEIVALVEESRIEISRENPNWSKLKSFLPMVGGAIGTMADMAPAYAQLKAAAALVGVTLP